MRLVSFLDHSGRTRVGVLDGDVVRDVTDTIAARADDGVRACLSPLRQALTRGVELTSIAFAKSPAADIASMLPVVPDPSKIVAAPVNYRDHQQEMGQGPTAIESLGVFLKAPSSLAANGALVLLPYDDRRFDQEGELAVVIGARASHVAPAGALDYVAGYTCVLDMTMRGGEDRSVRKSFDTFTPLGPALVTPDEVGPLDDVELHTWVGGRLRQRADLADLIWDVPRLIAYISSVMVLEPGDVIATGTPAGVGQVRDGDEVTVEITRVGRLTVTVSDAGAVACPTAGRDNGPVPPAEVTVPRERVRA